MNFKESSQNSVQEIMPLLIEIQHNLSGSVDLNSLATKYGYSPFHFHRHFSKTIGETPKKYVERLRLEKAAYKLVITQQSVLEIALSVGFNTHETFTRAFKRGFGLSPKNYRNNSWKNRLSRAESSRYFEGDECKLSEARFEVLRPMHLLSIRHVGDYFHIPDPFMEGDNLWTNLVNWAHDNDINYQDIPIAILHDDPNVTDPESQRCDACIPIEKEVKTTQNIHCISFAGGLYGVLEHIGPYETLDQAFRKLADCILISNKYRLREGAVLDIMRKVRVYGDSSVNHTDIFLPVEPL